MTIISNHQQVRGDPPPLRNNLLVLLSRSLQRTFTPLFSEALYIITIVSYIFGCVFLLRRVKMHVHGVQISG